MFFSRKKKIQRDRQAGLIFHWRGGYASNRGGMILALIIATSGFAIAFIGINVYITTTANPIRHRAKVTQTGEMDNNLRWIVERNSPHLTPWHTKQNQIVVHSVNQKLQQLINGSAKESLHWQTVSEDVLKLKQPQTYSSLTHSTIQFPSVQRLQQAPESPLTNPAKLEWNYQIEADHKLAKARLPEQLSYPLLNAPPNLLGATISFSITLDETGKVLGCLPLDWQTNNESTFIQNWLVTVRFKPAAKIKITKTSAKKGIQTIKLSVTITGRKIAEPNQPSKSP